MNYLKKIATAFCSAAIGLTVLTGCDASQMYNVNSPDWMSDSINAIKDRNAAGGETLVDLVDDCYTFGNTDFTSGWWSAFSKYYVIGEGKLWNAEINLHIKSSDNTLYYQNFALIISNDYDRGDLNYKEYGAIRYDNDPNKNSEWGDYINRSLVDGNLFFSSGDDNIDANIQKLAGKVAVIVDRTEGGLKVRFNNGVAVKTYTQTEPLANLNPDASNTNIRCFLVAEGSYVDFVSTNIEPIGGCTPKDDQIAESMELVNVPKKVLVGTDLATAMAGVQANVKFQNVPNPVTVPAKELQFQTIPAGMNTSGKKTLVAIYSKTYKGENSSEPVMCYTEFQVVDKMYTTVGNIDNTSPFAGAFSEDIKVNPGETFVTSFTNYTNGLQNWNNFLVELFNQDKTKYYATVRADNYGWGDGYAACTPSGGQADWAAWLAVMNGAKVTAFITNNGNGTADVKCIMIGTDGKEYIQDYIGINTVDPNDMYFHLTIEAAHLEFDTVVGAEDNTSPFAGAFSQAIKIPSGATYTTRFTNYTNGLQNWNNFLVELFNQDKTKYYATVRADNYGWGDGYAACTPSGGQADWAAWLAVMDGAKCTVSVSNNGNGTADVKCVMIGTDGQEYIQNYIGINTIEADNLYYHFTIEGAHLVFE